MTVQKSHGRSYPLVCPADELPAGTPAPARPAEPGSPAPERGQDGRLVPGAGTKALARKAALTRARKRQDAKAWGVSFGLGRMLETLTPDAYIAPFVTEGEEWLKAQCAAVARDVGGGELSPGVVSILRGASWSRLFSAFLFDCCSRQTFAWDIDEARTPKTLPRVELMLVAQRLADSSRQALLACHELASREAQARPEAQVDPLARWRLPADGKEPTP
jgi:hypothetical protein